MKNFCINLFILLMSLVGSFSIAANKNVQDAVAKIQAQTAKDIGAVGIEGYFGKRGGSDVFYPEDFKYIKSLIIKNPEALPKGNVRELLGKVKVWGELIEDTRYLVIEAISAVEKCTFIKKIENTTGGQVDQSLAIFKEEWMKALAEHNISCLGID